MTDDDIVNAFADMSPERLRDVYSRLARIFAMKAEALYDSSPMTNGEIAQPYADLSDFMEDASLVFEQQQQETAIEAASNDAAPSQPTLTETVFRNRPKKGWGDY